MPLVEQLLAGAKAHRSACRRPLVTLSYAQSLDGSLAAQRGRPLALSGPEAAALTHRLRAAHDAILVGIGTVLADDPRLTVRLASGKNPQPVVLDSHLRLPLGSNLLHRQPGEMLPWVAGLQSPSTGRQAQLEAAGARVLCFSPGEDGRVPLPALLERLAEIGVNSLMVEGGAQVITSFLAQGLADQAVLMIAPLFVGGLHAVESSLAPGNPAQPDRPAFPALTGGGFEQCGADLVLWGKIQSGVRT
jgi:3,4-dihydroxy 2-butanone 4-phosphate synthase/GTP cyclohydrolase II